MMGGSQAAHISFLAHAISDDVDFMLLSGAPSVELIEQERQSLLFRMLSNQEPQNLIDAALGYQDLYFHYVRTGDNWKSLKKAIQQNQNKTWTQYTDQPQSKSDLDWWRANYNSYQPQNLIPKINIPMLILYGENDNVTPPSIMVSNFQYHLKDSNNDAIEFVICPNVGHALEETFRRDQWGNVIFPQRSKHMFDAIDRWLIKNNLAES